MTVASNPTMHPLITSLILFLISSPVYAQYKCYEVFAKTTVSLEKAPSLELQFSPDFPQSAKSFVDSVIRMTPELNKPAQMTFLLTKDPLYEVGFANLETNSISLMSEAFKLSPKSFKALVAHEITHLIVTHNIHMRDKKTLAKTLSNPNMDAMDKMMATSSHQPFAELLCDTMAAIVTQDPRAILRMIDEIIVMNPKFAKLQESNPLSRRDFSLDPEDKNWKTYAPKDFTYNRMNQLRAHVWSKHMERRSEKEQIDAFRNLINVLDPIIQGNVYDLLTSQSGVYEANLQLIDYLSKALTP